MVKEILHLPHFEVRRARQCPRLSVDLWVSLLVAEGVRGGREGQGVTPTQMLETTWRHVPLPQLPAPDIQGVPSTAVCTLRLKQVPLSALLT